MANCINKNSKDDNNNGICPAGHRELSLYGQLIWFFNVLIELEGFKKCSEHFGILKANLNKKILIYLLFTAYVCLCGILLFYFLFYFNYSCFVDVPYCS